MREEEKKPSSPMKPSLKRALRKRWVFPAVYLTSAAVILAGVLWFQNNNDAKPKDEYQYSQDAPGTSSKEDESIPVNEAVEHVAMPVLDPNTVEIKTPFYDYAASKEEQEAALVFYNNTYHPNRGIDLVMKDGQPFDVTASLSGTVTKAEKDPILGYIVEIDHNNGVVTVYQSLANVEVKAGDTIKQGQIIGKAGQSAFNKEAGTHVHFEIRQNGKPVNPLDYVDKPVTTLTESNAQKENAQDENKQNTTKGESQDKSSSDDQSMDESDTNQDASYNAPDSSIGMAKA